MIRTQKFCKWSSQTSHKLHLQQKVYFKKDEFAKLFHKLYYAHLESVAKTILGAKIEVS